MAFKIHRPAQTTLTEKACFKARWYPVKVSGAARLCEQTVFNSAKECTTLITSNLKKLAWFALKIVTNLIGLMGSGTTARHPL
jgi:hypothetical protein